MAELVRLQANESPLGPSPRVVEAIVREAAARAPLPGRGLHRAPRGAGAPGWRLRRTRSSSATGPTSCWPSSLWPRWSRATRSWSRSRRSSRTRRWWSWPGPPCAPSPLAGYETDLDDMRRRVTAAHEGAHPLLAAQPGVHDHPPRAARWAPGRAPRGSAAGDPGRGVSRLLRRPRVPRRSGRCWPRYPRLIVLRTFSKIAGLAGLRVGYAVGSRETHRPLEPCARSLQRQPPRARSPPWPRWRTREHWAAHAATS